MRLLEQLFVTVRDELARRAGVAAFDKTPPPQPRGGSGAGGRRAADLGFDEVVNAIQDYAILLLDPSGYIATWNVGAQRLKGYAIDEVVGRHFSIFYPAEAVKRRHPGRVLELARTQGRYEEEGWRVRKDGSRFWANVVISTRRDRTGRVTGFVKVTRDLTERRAAEEELRLAKQQLERRIEERSHDLGQREKMLQLITDGLPMAVCYIDAAQRFRFANATCAAWRGTTREHLVGSRLRDVLGDEVYRGLRGQIEATLRGEPQTIEAEIQYSDKRRAVVALNVPDVAENGCVRGYIMIATDVTDQKIDADQKAFLAEAANVFGASLDYQTVLAKLARMVTERLADWCIVSMLGDDGQMERVAMAHSDPERMRWAVEVQRRYPPAIREVAPARRVATSGKSELFADITDEMLAACVSDPVRIGQLRAAGLRSAMVVPIEAHGRSMGALTFIASESGRRFSERDLAFAEEIGRRAGMAIHNARLYRDAQAANRMKDEFLATLSHELRTPLNSIVGWTDLIRSGVVGPSELDDAIDVVHRNAEAQVQLINELLDVSRIITGKMSIEPRPVDVGLIVANAVATLRLAVQAKNIQVDVMAEPTIMLVLGDPDRIQQVVWNLLSNAIKFTPKDGVVTVTLRSRGAAVEIEVADSGEGIEPRFLPHLFERFSQQDASMTRRHGGLGLGLSIVRHIVEAHGGSVRARSDGKGKGATFTVMLPVATATMRSAGFPGFVARGSAAASDRKEATVSHDLAGMRILVIDDDSSSRQLLNKVLSRHGASILEAESAAEALRIAQAAAPDIILSDIGMPEEDGLSLIRRIRALAGTELATTPAIALTAYARDEERLEALRAGYDAHLAKPIRASALLKRIAELAQVKDRPYVN